jgi:Na+-driven multidrug efflux pump
MNLEQMATVKRWHLTHHRQASVEGRVWDLVLTAWVMGLVGVPPALVLASALGGVACALLLMAPKGYVGLRRRLHRSGRLRCDWLGSLRAG